jgi:hypothetical protein
VQPIAAARGWAVNDRERFCASTVFDNPEDAQHTADWLNDRWRGYPLRDLPWPPDRPFMPSERARINDVCCREHRKEIERANNAAYHGDIDGDSDY